MVGIAYFRPQISINLLYDSLALIETPKSSRQYRFASKASNPGNKAA